jgi:hypothetical protein
MNSDRIQVLDRPVFSGGKPFLLASGLFRAVKAANVEIARTEDMLRPLRRIAYSVVDISTPKALCVSPDTA